MFNIKTSNFSILWWMLEHQKIKAVTIDTVEYQVVGLNSKNEPVFIHEESGSHDSVPLSEIQMFHFE